MIYRLTTFVQLSTKVVQCHVDLKLGQVEPEYNSEYCYMML